MILAAYLGFFAGFVMAAEQSRVVLMREALTDLNPICSGQSSFWASLLNTPREFQFFLHGWAVTERGAHIWSYRELRFVQIEQNVARNVIPSTSPCHPRDFTP